MSSPLDLVAKEADRLDFEKGPAWLADPSLSSVSTKSGSSQSTGTSTAKSYTSQLVDTAEVVREASRKIRTAKIKWDQPQSVLIITKPGDKALVSKTRDLVLWLMTRPRYGVENGLIVYVDSKLQKSRRFQYTDILEKHSVVETHLKFWTPELCRDNSSLFDFVITLGGDGTVLFASWLFQRTVPPVMSFHLGSLGFLTPFDFAKYQHHIDKVIERGVNITLRMRLTCTIYRCTKSSHSSADGQYRVRLRQVRRSKKSATSYVGDWGPCENLEAAGITPDGDGPEMDPMAQVYAKETQRSHQQSSPNGSRVHDQDSMESLPCYTTYPEETFEVLNEVVIDRGPSSSMSMLELFGDDQHLTTVQADGLAIATPTGSTAYSLSAGGSLTHPEIPAILITPLCAHTLSFRPMLLPDSMDLRVCVPFGSRSTAWASFDGRGRVELRQGDHMKITAGSTPFPTVCAEDQSKDWFKSLSKSLKWNDRIRQKSYAFVEKRAENDYAYSTKTKRDQPHRTNSSSSPRKPGPLNNRQSSTSSLSSSEGLEEVFATMGPTVYRFNDMDLSQSDEESDETISDDEWQQDGDAPNQLMVPHPRRLSSFTGKYLRLPHHHAPPEDSGTDGFEGWKDEEIRPKPSKK
ncbi:hypothetical protein BZG36_05034 [Bifiguratus adelaidae]|uniref:NAD+ kinase n=1 Tax=Bifiguratus adelaidae TaxID=1938954 RepID=A0A261XV78_9FUNG|nr:hypothetical protein BZG36_05034 [Bifiguratus adelaidae]